MRYSIYKTTCIPTGRFYVGMHATQNENDSYLGSGIVLKHSVRKYGRESHVKEILFLANSEDDMRKIEAEIVCESLLADPLCMNLQTGGKGRPGKTAVSKETREKISKSLSGKSRAPLKESTKQKISDVHKGKQKSEMHKKKLSDIQRGKELSTTHKANIARARTGTVQSTETRLKISQAKLGKTRTRRPLIVSGTTFESIEVACITLNKSISTLRRWINQGKARYD